MLRSFDDHHLAAEAANGLRHLDADRAAAQHEHAARDLLHAGHLAVRPDAFELAEAGDRRHDGVGAVRQDDVLGSVSHAVDLDHARPGELARPA